jgi:hypothetical protein
VLLTSVPLAFVDVNRGLVHKGHTVSHRGGGSSAITAAAAVADGGSSIAASFVQLLKKQFVSATIVTFSELLVCSS